MMAKQVMAVILYCLAAQSLQASAASAKPKVDLRGKRDRLLKEINAIAPSDILESQTDKPLSKKIALTEELLATLKKPLLIQQREKVILYLQELCLLQSKQLKNRGSYHKLMAENIFEARTGLDPALMKKTACEGQEYLKLAAMYNHKADQALRASKKWGKKAQEIKDIRLLKVAKK